MKKRVSAPLVVAGMVLGGLAISANTAFAHHPGVTGEVVCVDEVPSINYVSTAWEGFGEDPTNDPTRQNDQIDIYVEGVLVASGAYDAPDYSFAGTVPLPPGFQPGATVMMTAVAVADWGSGAEGGSQTSDWIDVPDLDCDPDLANGRFTGGGHQLRVDGVRVTRGLTIHCDLLLSNNLEINWNGNRFHMLEHLETVECTDHPDIIQDPPPAPLDTLIGVGTGRYNGAEGYTVDFTLQDHGEPGRNDKMAIRITEDATGTVVLDVPLQTLSGGNLQAHYDQPHK